MGSPDRIWLYCVRHRVKVNLRGEMIVRPNPLEMQVRMPCSPHCMWTTFSTFLRSMSEVCSVYVSCSARARQVPHVHARNVVLQSAEQGVSFAAMYWNR